MSTTSIGAPSAHARHDSAIDAWRDLLARFEANETLPATGDGEADDASIDLAGRLIEEIMSTPAPDAAAAKWKLDYILANGCTYQSDFIEQAKADYRRFLGVQTDEEIVAAAVERAENFVRSPFRQAYSDYRYTKAVWDVEMYLPERGGADVPDEINMPLMNAHSEATVALIMAPVRCLAELRQKLEVYREESLEQWGEGNKFTDALIADVRRLSEEASDV